MRTRTIKAALLGSAALATVAGSFTTIFASTAAANPLSATVTTGSASVALSPNKTQIDQKSEDVVIDWPSFNIGAGQTTQFVQPNTLAIAVNRIGGNAPSQILGTLDANGRIVLINGNGMLFGKGAAVNMGSLIATSTGGSDSDLLSGKFTQGGSRNASIINQGRIDTANGGMVALVAPNVSNAGTVNARFGTIALGAANKFTVDFAGDGLVSFAAQGDVNGRAVATNSGSLAGANVSLTAHAAEGVATGVVEMSGIVTAQTARNVGGTILLDAGNGSLSMTGNLNAASQTGGGVIETSGNQVAISGSVTAGQNGSWKVDPENLTIDSAAASTIDNALNSGTSVTELTTSSKASGYGSQSPGAGDIIVASGLSWNTSATLTLDSYHTINVNAPITVSGAGGVVLTTDNGGTNGSLSFGLSPTGFAGDIQFTGTPNSGQRLNINGTAYTLLYSMSDVQNINASSTTLGGNYALADSLSASGTSSWTPIGTDGANTVGNSGNGFTGMFEGLGNTISNLAIDLPEISNLGLFGYSNGTIRDVGMIGGSVSGASEVGELVGWNFGTVNNTYATGTATGVIGGADVGGLVGDDSGTISGSFATGAVKGSLAVGGLSGENDVAISNSYATGAVAGGTDVGGLIGYNGGAITNAYASGAVSGSASGNAVGGLVGYSLSFGAITNSFATGTVSAGSESAEVGGLVGLNSGTISNAYATGAVSAAGDVGGLVGQNYTGAITSSYATGAVTAQSNGDGAGGLVGDNRATISDSFATGTVNGGFNFDVGGLVGDNDGGTVSASYATGAASGDHGVGGLVGASDGTITDSYATGTVTAPSNSTEVGGLLGWNWIDGSVVDSYATGTVSGGTGSTYVGGLIGENFSGGTVTSSYWDLQTTSQSSSAAGTGLTTAQLSGALPGGFSSATWGNVNNQTTPYLLSNPGPVYIGSDGTHLFALVFTMGELQAINGNLTGNYALAAPLNAATDSSTPASWIPIGTDGAGNIENSGNGFAGIFDGLGNTISNLTINLPTANYVALFGYSIGTIRNVGIVGGTVTGYGEVGGLVGDNSGTITNAYATNAVAGSNEFVGGSSVIGGLVAGNSGTITDSFATGAVTGTGDVGGLAGSNTGPISNAYATGTVSGVSGKGGVVSSSAGGLVGWNDGTISASYASGAVSGGNSVGGLLGTTFNGLIENTYATGTVSGSNYVGGLLGDDTGTITDSYATGAVSGTADATYLGGLVGLNGGLAPTNSYWDTQTTNQSSSAGGTGLTTAQLSAALPGGFSSATWGNVNNQTTPYLLANPGPVYIGSDSTHLFTLVFTMGELQAINANLTGDYALATSLNAATDSSTPASWIPIGTDGAGNIENSGSGFAGIFDGLGNTISNPTTNSASTSYLGLFGYSSGTIRDVGLAAVSLTSSTNNIGYVGGLVAYNTGTVANSDVTASTGADGDFGYVGAVVGYNTGTITNSAAAGAVTNTGYGSYAGGLVGYSSGTISNSNATTTVTDSGSFAEVGGLVGENLNIVTGSSASGAVTASGMTNQAGGLVGDSRGSITASFATGAVNDNGSGINGGILGGLVGYNTGTIANSYATGAVAGTSVGYTGGLVGQSYDGSITNSYATGSVTSAGTDGIGTGGLVGWNNGTITDSYATGAIAFSNTSDAPTIAGGGLVGINAGGTISASYATGTVSSTTTSYGALLGGLVGWNYGTVTNDYATGAVNSASAQSAAGGLVGENTDAINTSYSTGSVAGSGAQILTGGFAAANYGTISSSAWDVQTSGQTAGIGTDNNNQSGNVAGLTTAQLQGALPGGFSNVVWGTGTNLFPYFLWQYPTATPQAVSGIAYSDAGITALAAGTVGGLVNGADIGNASTGANGYYYFLLAPGTISSNGAILVYTTGTNSGATLGENASGSLANLTILAGRLYEPTPDSNYSTVADNLAGAIGGDAAVASFVNGLRLQDIDASASNFTIDQAVDATILVLSSAGTITQSAAITATKLDLLGAGGSYALTDNANDIGTIAANTGAVNLADVGNLSVGNVNGTNGVTATGAVTLATSSERLAIEAPVLGTTITLDSAGAISESGAAGVIDGINLTGNSVTGAVLNGANEITDLGAFTNSGSGGFALTDGETLMIDGAVSAGSGNLSLSTAGTGSDIAIDGAVTTGGTVSLVSAGTISEASKGIITSAVLTGRAAGRTALIQANLIGTLGPFSDSGGSFDLSDDQNLTLTGVLNAGTNNVTLTDTGTLSTSGAGAIDAKKLSGAAVGGVILNGANKIADLGAFTNAGGGGFALTDGRTLTINGAVDGGTGDMSLQSGGNIDIDGAIMDGGTVTLTSGGAIAEGNGGSISAASLAGSGSAATKLNGANQIATLDDFTNLHGNMSLTDDEGLTVEGSVNTGKKNLTLQTSNGDLQITGSIDGGTITLGSALGEVDGTGAITAYILNVTANTGIDLTGPNAIKKLGTNQTNSGPDVIDGVK